MLVRQVKDSLLRCTRGQGCGITENADAADKKAPNRKFQPYPCSHLKNQYAAGPLAAYSNESLKGLDVPGVNI